ncbi:hypothetical protein NHX12_014244, partial [Muraenolepis orangiensis]
VFQGLLRAHRDFHDTKQSITRLWIHECFRSWAPSWTSPTTTSAPTRRPPSSLEDYNLTGGTVPMDLVLFRDAVEHITRAVRVISQPRGNMLLVGVGGSGRQSLSKMAAFICRYQVFQVEVTKQYRKLEFREDLKRLYRLTGVDNRPTVLVFSDTQVVEESFLEDLNNVLSSGEVPNLYKQDELDEVCGALSESARKDGVPETPGSVLGYLIERVRNNLHVVLCMSPVGEPFRNRMRQYPALVNCTTIDWFWEWPRGALLEIQTKVAGVFVTMHQSVARFSHRMREELRRHNYVTPTNYLELVSGYKKLLGEKRGALGEQVAKLRSGLHKIEDTRAKVQTMSLELEEAKGEVADFQRQCEEYLVVIVQQKREADEQQKSATTPPVSVTPRRSRKIAAEEVKCVSMAENAQRDLDEALPALEEAMKALESLNKKDMTEIKSYGRPPALVETVMQAVMILLGESSFIKSLVNFDKDNISNRVLKKTAQYCTQADFQPDIIGRVSLAAKSLCMWVRAMERARLQAATSQLAEKQASLAEAQGKLREVGEKLEQLKEQYDEKLATKEELRRRSEDMELKLDRAAKLVSGLAGERGLEENMGYLVGDCLLAASCLSYLGPFLSSYRDELVAIWMKEADHGEGLEHPGWPLMVDPQGQALKWIKNMERDRRAVQSGEPVLLQNVQEELDPALSPILNKALTHVGDKEVDYSPDFRFYMTTKLSNPHYPPEVSTKTTIVNFAVKEQERPDLEEQKDSLVISIASGRRTLQELEDEILRLLNEATGSLLDDAQLVNALQTSKVTATRVSEQLDSSEQTEVKIDTAREGYRACARRASVLFFVLNDMGRVDPMYQFSLDAYVDLFHLSMERSPRSHKYTCRGLFEAHKLLFSFQMCTKILEVAGRLNMDDWLGDSNWDHVTELDRLAGFRGIMASFEQRPGAWHRWYTSDQPETAPLPGEWEGSLKEMQRMLVVRSVRPDRVSSCVTSFIVNHLGSRFVEPPVLHMKAVLEDSTPRTPLIFVLSPGVDPTGALGIKHGHWVFLANCHLSLSWMPELDKLVEQLQVEPSHPDFRLWLSSSPHPDFPGIKANMKRLYQLVPEARFARCSRPLPYRRLLFSLCFFHSLLLERTKFLQLGWNIVYGFNDADFQVSENLLSLYLDDYEEVPWEALRHLIAGVNYGGHVTDDWDRRLLTTYMGRLFCDAALSQPFFRLSSLPAYYIPRDGSRASYLDYVGQLPPTEHPEAFGQHPNADIASQIAESRTLFDTLLSLQPRVPAGGGGGGAAEGGGPSKEDKVLELSAEVRGRIPDPVDYEGTRALLQDDPSPLNVVLLQEIQRYNALLDTIRMRQSRSGRQFCWQP